MEALRSEGDLVSATARLVGQVPAFAPIALKARDLPLRFSPPGYRGLASIVVSQMVSRASAEAIWARLESATGGVAPETILAMAPAEARAVGLSGGKERTLRALAQACQSGLDLAEIAEREAEDAIAALTSISGIGPWSAEVFLLFSAGHPDIFPAGDVALQSAAQHAFGLDARLKGGEFRRMAEDWRPFRSIAARILWAYYAHEIRASALPVAPVEDE